MNENTLKRIKDYIEIYVVKFKIALHVFRQSKILVKIRVKDTLPNKAMAKLIRKRKNFYEVELDRFQVSYVWKGNTYSALNCVFHYLKTKKINSKVIFADLSDGGNDMPLSSREINLSFSSNNKKAVLIPDHNFTSTKGYAELRNLISKTVSPWNKRKNRVTWRGSVTGNGLTYSTPFEFDNLELLPRVRMCLKLLNHPHTDVAIVINKWIEQDAFAYQKLVEAGIAKPTIQQEEWLGFKFAIDIDGNTNAWQNFFSRMLMGCCVIKIDSFQNYQQWYYHQLEPWKHYVPAKADLSDLKEKIEWCQANLDECEQIATNAQKIAFRIAEKETQNR